MRNNNPESDTNEEDSSEESEDSSHEDGWLKRNRSAHRVSVAKPKINTDEEYLDEEESDQEYSEERESVINNLGHESDEDFYCNPDRVDSETDGDKSEENEVSGDDERPQDYASDCGSSQESSEEQGNVIDDSEDDPEDEDIIRNKKERNKNKRKKGSLYSSAETEGGKILKKNKEMPSEADEAGGATPVRKKSQGIVYILMSLVCLLLTILLCL